MIDKIITMDNIKKHIHNQQRAQTGAGKEILRNERNDQEAEGAVLVKRADGSLFRISPEEKGKSPFEGIKTLFDLRHNDIMQALRETREEN